MRVRDAITAEIKVTTGFTVESWLQILHSCAAQDSLASVPQNNNYVVAIREKYMETSTDVITVA